MEYRERERALFDALAVLEIMSVKLLQMPRSFEWRERENKTKHKKEFEAAWECIEWSHFFLVPYTSEVSIKPGRWSFDLPLRNPSS